MKFLQLYLFLCFIFSGCNQIPFSENASSSLLPKSEKTLFQWSGKVNDDNKDENTKADQTKDIETQDNNPRSKPLQSDRPDFTEASSTVGKGVVQLETGYTYTRDSDGINSQSSHYYPQSLLRIGLFEDWFEFRLGQNFLSEYSSGQTVNKLTGAQDTYLGVKLALTEQHEMLPELALILQTTVPTGHRELTSEQVMPGINFLFGWDIIKDKLDFGGSLQANKVEDDTSHSYLQIAQSLTVGYTLTEKLSAYTECFAFYPSGAIASDIGPQYYLDGGFTYKLTNNIQFDINAGIGLNRQADNYFVGTGLVLRY